MDFPSDRDTNQPFTMDEHFAYPEFGPDTSVSHETGRAGLGQIFADWHLKDEWLPRFRSRQLGPDQHLLTSDHGSWMLLSGEDRASLSTISMPRQLFASLEERGLIQTAANAARLSQAWKTWCSNYYTGTSLHILGVTRRCNLQCRYCHATVVPQESDPAKYDMPIEVGRRVVDFAFESPSPQIHFEFQGGEATLNPELIRDLYHYARAKNLAYRRELTFSIVSNLVDIDPELVQFLISARIRVATTVELADENEVAERVDRNDAHHRDEVEANRHWLREQGMFVPSLMVMNRSNLHRARDYIDHAIANGQKSVFLSPVQKLGFAKKHWARLGIEAGEFLDAWRDGLEYIFTLWDAGIMIEERLFAIALQKVSREFDVRYMDFRNPNGTVLGNIAYDQHGNAFACDEGRAQPFFRIGNVFEQSYAEMVTSPRAREIVSWSLREEGACRTCAYKPYCGVHPIVSHAQTGNPVPRPMEDFHCRLTQGIFDFLFECAATRPQRIAQAQFVHEAISDG